MKDESYSNADYSEDEPEENDLDEYCPKCGKDYDAIDYEYQICHYCKYENSK